MKSMFFASHINIATRSRAGNVSSCLDHIWTNFHGNEYSGVVDADITDHSPIFIAFNLRCGQKIICKTFRNHSLLAVEQLKFRMKKYVASFLDATYSNVDQMMNEFLDGFSMNYNECCRILRKNLKEGAVKKPWMTSGLMVSIRRKHELFRSYKSGIVPFEVYSRRGK